LLFSFWCFRLLGSSNFLQAVRTIILQSCSALNSDVLDYILSAIAVEIGDRFVFQWFFGWIYLIGRPTPEEGLPPVPNKFNLVFRLPRPLISPKYCLWKVTVLGLLFDSFTQLFLTYL
jgi:hypothetical protein